MFVQAFRSLVCWVLNPPVRLKAVYPWGAKQFGKTYVFGTIWFYIGSFLPLVLWLGAIAYGLAFNQHFLDWLMSYCMDRYQQPAQGFLVLMMVVSFVLGFASQMWYLNRQLRKDGMSLRRVMALDTVALRRDAWWKSILSFVIPIAIAFGVIHYGEQLIVHLLGPPKQETVDFLKTLSQGNQYVFLVVAALGAPFVEEMVFRGFLFQALRSVFRQITWVHTKQLLVSIKQHIRNLPWTLLRCLLYSPHYLIWVIWKILCLAVLAISFMWVPPLWRSIVNRWHNPPTPVPDKPIDPTLYAASEKPVKLSVKECLADYAAILVSAFIFWLAHLQFHHVTMIVMVFLAIVHCELYRRTGSLYTTMTLHFINNFIAVYTIMKSMNGW